MSTQKKSIPTKAFGIARAVRIDIAALLDHSQPVPVPAGKISSDAVASLLRESNCRGLEHFLTNTFGANARAGLTVGWWMCSPQSLRFGSADDLLNELIALATCTGFGSA